MRHTASSFHRPLTALVTGGGGFLGRAVVEQLLARGDRVRSLARGVYPDLAALGVEVLRGDLRDAQAVGQACAGCDVVFHVAAKSGIWGRYDTYFEPNVRGTHNVLAACREHGVPRLVYTSSPSVIFDGRSMEGVDESTPYPHKYHSHYSATKALAEQAVLAANGETLHTLALRPHLIWGPWDNHLVPRIVRQGQAGTLRRVGDGTNKVDTTYIDNAARAHLVAADALETNPRAAGRPFFISQGEFENFCQITVRHRNECGQFQGIVFVGFVGIHFFFLSQTCSGRFPSLPARVVLWCLAILSSARNILAGS